MISCLLSWATKPLKIGSTFQRKEIAPLTLLHSEWPKLHRVLAILSAKGLRANPVKKGDKKMVK